MRLCLPVLAVLCLPGRLDAAPPKLTLEQVIAKALSSAKVRVADGDTAIAAARITEADAARWPRIKGTLFGTASPEVRCLDPACTITNTRDISLNFDGVYGSAQLELTQ